MNYLYSVGSSYFHVDHNLMSLSQKKKKNQKLLKRLTIIAKLFVYRKVKRQRMMVTGAEETGVIKKYIFFILPHCSRTFCFFHEDSIYKIFVMVHGSLAFSNITVH